MADYSIGDLVTAARQAGFEGAALATVVAVSLAEDGARELRAVGTNHDGSRDRGPWQINDRAHPDVSDACAFDLTCAAGAAFTISGQGRNFQPWTTWTSGAYKQHLADAQAVAGGSTDPTAQQAASDPVSSAVQALTGQLLGAGQVAAGAVLVLAGIALAIFLAVRRG